MKRSRQFDTMRKIRKPMPPPTKAINPKKQYRRRDWDWREAVDDLESEGDEGIDSDGTQSNEGR